MTLELHDPWLLVLLAIPAAMLWLEWKGAGRWRVWMPAIGAFRREREEAGTALSLRRLARPLVPALRAAGLALLVVALARPIGDRSRAPIEGEGIDIALVVDVSGSMETEDLSPGKTRLDVVKGVLAKFVEGRRGDRMGLIAFAKFPMTVCPFTIDEKTVARFVARLETAQQLNGEDGTAIGAALAQAARRLKKSTAKSRVVVLLTDGENNELEVLPEDAARLAASLGIRVYTIMAGRDRGPRGPYSAPSAETKTLVDIARATGGRFWRAEDAGALSAIYREIGSLEKSKLDENRFESFTDLFRLFVIGGLLSLVAATALDATWLRRLP